MEKNLREQSEQGRVGFRGLAADAARTGAWLSRRCSSRSSAVRKSRPHSAQAAPTSSYSTYGIPRWKSPSVI